MSKRKLSDASDAQPEKKANSLDPVTEHILDSIACFSLDLVKEVASFGNPFWNV